MRRRIYRDEYKAGVIVLLRKPPWKEVYSRDERMRVAAYVLSKEFAP